MEFGVNQAIVEELYQRYRDNPRAVGEAWQRYFESLDRGEARALAAPAPSTADVEPAASTNVHAGNGSNGGNGASAASALPSLVPSQPPPPFAHPLGAAEQHSEYQERVTALVNGYRLRGHRHANLDPLGVYGPTRDDLSLERFGLDTCDPETRFATGNFAGGGFLPLREIVQRLRETYTRTIGVEYRNIEEPGIRAWLQQQMEPSSNHPTLDVDQQIRILSKLTDAELFERFLHTKYVGAKRFSLEGAESLIPLLELVTEHAGAHEIEEIVFGMAHRGRLNVLANVLEKDLEGIFASFEDGNPEAYVGRGDVKYHLGYSSDRIMPNGRSLHLTLTFNPSHLEWVDPVVEGRARAKQDRRGDVERQKVLPLLIHGDAAVAGQGIVQETINLGALRGYSTGGTVHIVINNQIGFTTVWQDGRSTRYCTDVMRMLRCPIFHVNGEDPEALAQVVKVAMAFRQRYSRDVVIDMYCYRRYGHNEADEPRFTQPTMYAAVDQKPSVRQMYVERLLGLGSITQAQADEIERARHDRLEAALAETRAGRFVAPSDVMQGLWAGYAGGLDADCPDVETRVDQARLSALLNDLTRVPEGFAVHPKLERMLDMRREQARGERPLDWGAAEALAYATLVTQDVSVRLSGQDSRRGTFSHRHAVLYDHMTGKRHVPLARLRADQARFEVWDSPLSEGAVLGFEWGFSLDSPDALVLWEAQFGDFCNTAQVIIDQFISSSEDKWYRLSGLVCLLPHGFEGQGPEHSSARLERWLNLCAEDNMQVCNATTPAQFFHLLRRQALRRYRKPLIVMSPKSLLRSPAATSSLAELSEGAFQPFLDDTTVEPERVSRFLLCSGKLYYELDAARRTLERDDLAIVRAEQLYPLRKDALRALLARYPDGAELVWTQEEPVNMGAWNAMRARLPEVLGERPLRCIARPESASPATGSHAAHKIEQTRLIEQAMAAG